MAPRAFVCGVADTALTTAEREFLRDADPWGIILFERNCRDDVQVRRLVDDFRACVGRADAPVLIDQEGGRVQRLCPPVWARYPAAQRIGRLYPRDRDRALDAARSTARLIAADLHALGITVDCAPCLDLPQPDASEVIGDRAYGTDPGMVAELGRAAAEGFLQGGVLPIIKHVPGHGRARVDSHKALPRLETPREDLQRHDFAPFAELHDLPIAMTAHVVYCAYDADHPATLSKDVIEHVIRREIGFQGLLITDDLSMKALTGSLRQRAELALQAGCDIALHCNGRLDEMEQVADASPALSGPSAARVDAALARLRPPEPFDVDEARGRLDALLAESV